MIKSGESISRIISQTFLDIIKNDNIIKSEK